MVEKVLESSLNYECSICMNIMIIPVILKCGHSFCVDCIEAIAYKDQNPICPMDRKPFNKDESGIKFNDVLQRKILLKMPKEFDEYGRAYLKEKNKVKTEKRIGLLYGNEHTLIQSDPNLNHKWTAFVRLAPINKDLDNIISAIRAKANLDEIFNESDCFISQFQSMDVTSNKSIEDFVEKVTFKLHPTFTPSEITKAAPPFALTRMGWGTFDITAIVTFKSDLKLKNKSLIIPLSFDSELSELTDMVDL